MALDCAITNAQLQSDGFVGVAFGCPAEHLEFPVGWALYRSGEGSARDLRHHLSGNLGIEGRLAFMHCAHGLDDIGRVSGLQYVAVRSRLQDGQDVRVIVKGAQYEYPGVSGVRSDPAGDLDPAHPRHLYIQHYNIRGIGPNGLHRGGAIIRLRDHLDVPCCLQELTDAGPDDRVIVCQDRSDRPTFAHNLTSARSNLALIAAADSRKLRSRWGTANQTAPTPNS